MSTPWENEPTPLANNSLFEVYSPRLKLYVDLETARNLERRMRAAERLLEDSMWNLDGDVELKRKINAHLAAAKEETK